MSGVVLFLDLARQTGFAEGEPGERAKSGSHRLAEAGSSSAVVFAGMIGFLGARLQAFRPRTIIYESPFDPRHMKKINANTIRIAWGLPAIVEGVAHRMGVHDIREANVNDVRNAMLGFRPKKDEAKQAVIQHVRMLGYNPADDNEADALLGFLYASTIIDPKAGIKTAPLFAGTN